MKSLLVTAYNVSESVIQTTVHVILRDLTNYYWNKEIEELENQVTPENAEFVDDLQQNENTCLPSPNNEMEVSQPELEDVTVNYDDALHVENSLEADDKFAITNYTFDQLKDNFDHNEENEKEYIKELNILPEVHLEIYDKEVLKDTMKTENSLNGSNENINCLSKLKDTLNQMPKLHSEQENISENVENEVILTNIPEKSSDQKTCLETKSCHNSCDSYSDEVIENLELLDENNKIINTLEDSLNGLPTLKEENLVENLKDNLSLSNIFENTLELKLSSNLPNELDNYPKQISCPDIESSNGYPSLVTTPHVFNYDEPNQNSNLSDENNQIVSVLVDILEKLPTLESEKECFSDKTKDDASLSNVLENSIELSQHEDNFDEAIINFKPSDVHESFFLSDYIKKKFREEKEILYKDNQGDKPLQNKSHLDTSVGQNQVPQFHFGEPIEKVDKILDVQSTHTHGDNNIGIDCLWEDGYISKYQSATLTEVGIPNISEGNATDDDKVEEENPYTVIKDTIPKQEYNCYCWMTHACLQVMSSDDEDDLLTNDQLESVETGSVSDWLYRVNRDIYWQPPYCIMNKTIQETSSQSSDDQQIGYEDDIEIQERYIKTLYIKNWLEDKQNNFKNDFGCGDYNEF